MEKKSSPEVEVLISVDESHISQISEIAKQFSSKGLRNAQEMKGIGVISGKFDPDMLNEMRNILGVSAIEVSGEIQIPLPESDIQ
uniref:Uncharacterized protein n=2 Tax=unclassified Candidatus Kentrum TaxID=2643149 RepID=A0A451ALU9_9GAMM|nr:MAG: hypothetical protein BECKLPF1236B_GA0070989_106222 [Candidatus Kentron sp. LPFa]VFK67006.1 MAG: hypothetical protein BECKUNK1418G_GA0071005_112110 [Candidatus Kentron sp. UNK]VFK72448.1 MAG: hypothetical protein BECKUNK1418H_GA0071006_111510 [Candidatus Kentron sp. UNK]